MKNMKLHIRFTFIALIIFCCGVNSNVWGQSATTTLNLTSFPSTGITGNYNNPIIGTASESITFSLTPLLSTIISTLGVAENDLYGTLYLRWYVVDKS